MGDFLSDLVAPIIKERLIANGVPISRTTSMLMPRSGETVYSFKVASTVAPDGDDDRIIDVDIFPMGDGKPSLLCLTRICYIECDQFDYNPFFQGEELGKETLFEWARKIADRYAEWIKEYITKPTDSVILNIGYLGIETVDGRSINWRAGLWPEEDKVGGRFFYNGSFKLQREQS
jgi:hypothetical protein